MDSLRFAARVAASDYVLRAHAQRHEKPTTVRFSLGYCKLRKIIKTRGHFPNDDAAIKLLWLALRNVLAKNVRSAFDWKSAMNQFAILFGDRFTQARG